VALENALAVSEAASRLVQGAHFHAVEEAHRAHTLGDGVAIGAGVAVDGGGVAVMTTVITAGVGTIAGVGVGLLPQPTISAASNPKMSRARNLLFMINPSREVTHYYAIP
jgi:hypothetical protein